MCPPKTLHVRVAWLVAVHASYPVDKYLLWERHGQEWTAELGRVAAQDASFRITYGHVVATDSAVIALAQPTEPVNRIRGMIGERLRLPPETGNEADLVHTTLFRYGGALSDPDKLLARLDSTSAETTAEVEELVVSKELVYPSLEAEVLGRLPLYAAGLLLAMRLRVHCHHVHLTDDHAVAHLQRCLDHEAPAVRVLASLPERCPILTEVLPIDAMGRPLVEDRPQVLGDFRLATKLEGGNFRILCVGDAQPGVLGVEAEREIRIASLDGVTQSLGVQPCGALAFRHIVRFFLSSFGKALPGRWNLVAPRMVARR